MFACHRRPYSRIESDMPGPPPIAGLLMLAPIRLRWSRRSPSGRSQAIHQTVPYSYTNQIGQTRPQSRGDASRCMNSSELLELGREAADRIASEIRAGANLVHCQLLASQFYEALKLRFEE